MRDETLIEFYRYLSWSVKKFTTSRNIRPGPRKTTNFGAKRSLATNQTHLFCFPNRRPRSSLGNLIPSRQVGVYTV